jgi:large subunit ribosomal protein L13e
MMKLHVVVLKGKGRTRRGRGFSRDELKEAGIDPKQALKLGVPIDPRRNTKHKENVKILKQYLRSSRSESAAKPRAK